MYRKVLFRGNKRVQSKELLEIQSDIPIPDFNIGLRRGGFISLVNNRIYIAPALISLPTHSGFSKAMEMPLQQLDLNPGKYYLKLITTVSKGTEDPFMGGPFIGSVGSDVESTNLIITKDRGDYHLFTISLKGDLLVTDFFKIDRYSADTYVKEGLSTYSLADSILIGPGAAWVDGHSIVIDNAIRLDTDLPQYLIYLSNQGQISIEVEEPLTNHQYVTLQGGEVIQSSMGSQLIGRPTLAKFSGLYLYRVSDGVPHRLFNYQSHNNLDELMDEVIQQREAISSLYLLRSDTASRTSINLLPGLSSDINHPSFFAAIDGNKVLPFTDEVKAVPIGDRLNVTKFTTHFFSGTSISNGESRSLIPTNRSPLIRLTPNFIPTLNNVRPDNLFIKIEAQDLEPLSYYYLSINDEVNYSSRIRSDIGGYLSIQLDLVKDQVKILESLSLHNEREIVVSRSISEVRTVPSYQLPATTLLGQRFIPERSLYLHSIDLSIELPNDFPNVRLIDLYLVDEADTVIAKASNSTQSRVFIFDVPVYLRAGESYKFFLSTTYSGIGVALSSSTNTASHLLLSNGEVDLNSSITHTLTEAIPAPPANTITSTDLSNSFSLSSSYKYPSTWVSKHYDLRNEYKSIKVIIECTSDDIEVYSSPNHMDWDRLSISSIDRYKDGYRITLEHTYGNHFYENSDGISVLRTGLSILIDMNSYTEITRVEGLIFR